MVLKNECSRFLDAITSLRNATIDRGVQKAVELKHLPYKAELEETRDKMIVQAKNKAEEEVRAIYAQRDSKVEQYRLETEMAIKAHRESVINAASAQVKNDYDNFILGVSKLVDNTNIND